MTTNAPKSPLVPFIGDRTPRVLIVDDEPVNLKVLAAHLTRWGCRVQTAADGATALEAARASAPDLILLDILMPGLSGFDVAKALQADPATRNTPVIFLTALAGGEAKEMGFEIGARDYITKPFVAAELAARLGARLRDRYAEEALRARQAELAAGMPKDEAPQP